MSEKPILIATVGLPRSGKSTWSRSTPYPIVNPDSIRLAMHGQRYAKQAEPLVWATARIMVQSLFFAGHRIVILDATNVERKRRDEWQNAEWDVYFKLVNTPRDVCIQRAIDLNDPDIIPVIYRMHAGYQTLESYEKEW